MWKRLQNVYSQIKQTRLKPLSQPIWQPPPLHPVSYQPPTHRRLLPFPVRAFIIGEDSFVITSRQFGIHSCLQCAFQRLVHSAFLESIMLFSSCSKDSLYPSSRSRVTMELSPHPHDIRLRVFVLERIERVCRDMPWLRGVDVGGGLALLVFAVIY